MSNRTLAWGGLALVLLVILIILSGIYKFSVGDSAFLSVDKVTLTSTNQFFSGEDVWVITAKGFGGISQSLEFKPQYLQTSDGQVSEDYVALKIITRNQECVYVLQKDDSLRPVAKKRVLKWTCLGANEEKCTQKAISQPDFYSIWSQFDVCGDIPGIPPVCVVTYNTEEHPIGRFSDYYIDYDTKIILQIGEDTIAEATINPNQKIVFLPSGKSYPQPGDYAYISLEGFLSRERSCKYVSDMPYFGIYNSGWRIVRKGYYDDYLGALNDRPSFAWKEFSARKVEDWVNRVNYFANIVLNKAMNDGISDSTKDSALFHTEAETRGYSPIFQIVIKANKLRVRTQNPAPEIIKVKQKNVIGAGSIGELIVNVRNNGESGMIHLTGSCDDSRFKIFNRDVTIPSGSIKEITMEFTGSTDKKLDSANCVIKAYAVGGESSKSIQLYVKGEITCNPNTKSCGFDVEKNLHYIAVCNSDGTGISVDKYCEPDEVCQNAKCVKEGAVGDEDIDQVMRLLVILGVVLTMLSIIIGVMTGKSARDKVTRALTFGFITFVLFIIIILIVKIFMLLLKVKLL